MVFEFEFKFEKFLTSTLLRKRHARTHRHCFGQWDGEIPFLFQGESPINTDQAKEFKIT